MKFGVREICDVVLKAKAENQLVGTKKFSKGEPVMYFDSLKTSSMEGAATTVYAQGGRGNSRLVAWDGERTVTFTMEDALISPMSFAILSGAGLMEAGKDEVESINVHVSEKVKIDETTGKITLTGGTPVSGNDYPIWCMVLNDQDDIETTEKLDGSSLTLEEYKGKIAIIDYYVAKTTGATQIDIRPDQFGGNFYLEASTLFRTTEGVDMPAEFIIPNCKIQSNFTFTMASSGDPSTFTFTMDAFPDYIGTGENRVNAHKVLAAIQIVENTSTT
jgi:hypothetical protein